MTEKTKQEKDHEKEQLIRSLGMEDLKKLSMTQLMLVQQVQLQRTNENARKRVDGALEGKKEEIAKAMTQAPYIWIGPEIRVMAGAVVRFSSMMNVQLRDTHKLLDEFIKKEDPNEIRITDFLNRHLLAHSLCWYNGEDFGGVIFDAGDYQALRQNDRKEADKMLSEVCNKRLEAIDDLSPHVVQRLIEYYQAFQLAVESVTKEEDMEEVLGN